jgi:transposase-like protein
MTRPGRKDGPINITKQDLHCLLTEDDAMRKLMQTLIQEALEAEMDQGSAGRQGRADGAGAWGTAAATTAAA